MSAPSLLHGATNVALSPMVRDIAARPPLPPRTARSREPNATLVERRDLTPDLARFRFRPDAGVPAFIPGQYVPIALPTDAGPLIRPYSIAAAPHDLGIIELFVRRLEGGACTARLWALEPGARLWIGPPRGLFMLRPVDGSHHVLIATGTGLAPMIAMLAALADRPARPPATLIHGVAHVSELGYRDELEGWSRQGTLDYRPTISRPTAADDTGWDGAVGRVDGVLADLLAARDIDVDRSVAYVCGNDGMIATIRQMLVRAGMPETSIHSERFAPAAAA